MLGDLDAWTKDIARENKILGDTADTHAYDKCYVPLRREPGEGILKRNGASDLNRDPELSAAT